MSGLTRKICVVTGTRAEYGLLLPLLEEIRLDPELELQIVATGMHLAPEFGLTFKEIEQDGFAVDAKVEMLLASDTPVGIAKSIGLGTIGFADAYHQLKPDLVVLTGDRFELLAAAQAALVARLPVAHIAGGDTTEGAFDESIRHAVTKMAQLHFVTNEGSRRRVIQLGENPERVFNFGSLTVDRIQRMDFLSRQELERELDFKLRKVNYLVTFHPVTLENDSSSEQFGELLAALDSLGPDAGIIFTGSNADTGGRTLLAMMNDFVNRRPGHARAFTSLGQLRYYSLMRQVDAVVGNSSSGLYEAPSFKLPTVNIGDRQKGRLRAASIIDCEPHREAILAALQRAQTLDCSTVVNPYGEGGAAPKMKDVLKRTPLENILKKAFYSLSEEH